MLPNRKTQIKKSTLGTRNPTIAGSGIKRPGQTSSAPAVKKQKFELPKQGIAGSSIGPSSSTSSTNSFMRIVELDTSWQTTTKDITITAREFQAMIKANREKGKTAKAFCAAVKLLLNDDGASMDIELFKEVMQAVPHEVDIKKSQSFFGAVFELLNKVETTAALINMSVLPVALQMLRSLEFWPANFFNYVLYDSMGTRLWVDKPEATVIVLAAFSLFGEVIIPSEDMFQSISDQVSFMKDVPREPPKYEMLPEQKTAVFKTTIEYIERAMEQGSSKPLIRTLCMLCANEQFRLMAAQKLDIWLLHNKYQRYAMELVLFIACNTRNLTSKIDLEILSLLSKLRLQKSRQVQNVFQNSIKEIVNNCPESLQILTELIVENDLTNSSKAQNNIGFLQFLFTQNPTEVLKLVAKRLIKRLENPEQLKHVRLFVREFYRSLSNTPFSNFSLALLEAMRSYNSGNISLVFQSCLDLFCMLPFLATSSSIRDAAQIRRNSGNLSSIQLNVLERFQQQFQKSASEAVSTVKWIVENFKLDPAIVVDSCSAILYLRPYQFYVADGWPTEVDFNNTARIIAECPIDEKLIQTLIELKSQFVSSIELLTLLKNLTSRSLNCGTDLDSNKGVCIRSGDTVVKLFNLSLITQQNAHNVKLADRELYWRCWELIFCWSCVSSSLLKNIYPLYPTLRMIFTMAISNDFHFPPIRMDSCTEEQIRAINDQERERELDAIKKLEHQDVEMMEDNTRTELGLFCFLDPTGPVRQPPTDFINRLKHLNEQFAFSVNLCQLSEPNILAQVCSDLGPTRILQTVIVYLTAKPNQIENVPLVCVCQMFLIVVCQQNAIPVDLFLHSISASTRQSINAELQDLVCKIVKSYVTDEKRPVEQCRIVLEFLIGKLSASISDERDTAIIGLGMLLGGEQSSTKFDPDLLANIAHFVEFQENLCLLLATACTIEKRSNLITKYLEFIVKNINENSMHLIAASLSAIVERANSANAEHKAIRQNLIKFFADFMRKTIADDNHTLSGKQSHNSAGAHDKLAIQLSYPKSIRVEIDGGIVKAIMELLCESFDDYDEESTENESREYLMNIWFPSTKLIVTLANDPTTVINILPEALKMKMMSAKDARIVKVALSDTTPEKALKFIQTFALSSFSCTELLRILNNSSIGQSKAALSAVPFVQAYRGCDGAEQFLQSLQSQNDCEIKMEVDQDAPALFQPIQNSPGIPDSIPLVDDEQTSVSPSMPDFNDSQSIVNYLNQVITDPANKEASFALSSTWAKFLNTLKNSSELSQAAVRFAHEHLMEMNREVPRILYSLFNSVVGHSDPSLQKLLSALSSHVRRILPDNKILLALLKPYSRASLRPMFTKKVDDVKMTMVANDENEEDSRKINKDLELHWFIAEYFEAVLISNNSEAKQLARRLRKELNEHVKREPIVFSRQLPLLFNHVQTLLKLNVRQATDIDSYSALLHIINLVVVTGESIFSHTQAFETFIELFLNSMAAHSVKSRQWESVMDRLTNLMRNYLNWNPTIALTLVERNKSALYGLRSLYPDLKNLNEFLDEFPQFFRF